MTKIKRIMASKVLPKDKIYLFGKWEAVTCVSAVSVYTVLQFGAKFVEIHLPFSRVIRVQREEVK